MSKLPTTTLPFSTIGILAFFSFSPCRLSLTSLSHSGSTYLSLSLSLSSLSLADRVLRIFADAVGNRLIPRLRV